MKLLIVKKSIKEGENDGRPYKIKSLYVSFDEPEVYQNIVKYLESKGAASDKIESFCKPKEYEGKVNYAFGLNCSKFTFDKVARFGILDAKVIFDVTEKGFINAKIQVVDKKEQITLYEPPTTFAEDEVEGWEIETPTEVAQKADATPPTDFSKMTAEEIGKDLPF